MEFRIRTKIIQLHKIIEHISPKKQHTDDYKLNNNNKKWIKNNPFSVQIVRTLVNIPEYSKVSKNNDEVEEEEEDDEKIMLKRKRNEEFSVMNANHSHGRIHNIISQRYLFVGIFMQCCVILLCFPRNEITSTVCRPEPNNNNKKKERKAEKNDTHTTTTTTTFL